MATQWQGPHYIVIALASAVAFAGGYTMAGRSRPAYSPPPPATNGSMGNDVAGPAGFPGFDSNTQAPPARRGRPDENALIAENAEPEEPPHEMGTPRPREPGDRDAGRGHRPRRDPRDDPPPEQPYDEDSGYDPQGE